MNIVLLQEFCRFIFFIIIIILFYFPSNFPLVYFPQHSDIPDLSLCISILVHLPVIFALKVIRTE